MVRKISNIVISLLCVFGMIASPITPNTAVVKAAGNEINVTTWDELSNAINQHNQATIVLKKDLKADKTLSIGAGKDITIKGNNHTIYRQDGSKFLSMFTVNKGGTLRLEAGLTMSGKVKKVFYAYDHRYTMDELQLNGKSYKEGGFFVNNLTGTVYVNGAVFEDFKTASDVNGVQYVAPIFNGTKGKGSVPSKFYMTSGVIRNNEVAFRTAAYTGVDGHTFAEWGKGLNKPGRVINSYFGGTRNETAGAIVFRNDSIGEISGNAIIENNRGGAGAINAYAANVTLSDNVKIRNNEGMALAGAIYIYGNTGDGVLINSDGVEIANNLSWRNGAVTTDGASKQRGGRFVMNAGKIHDNYSYDKGGAIRVISNGVSLNGGELYNNVARVMGGAIYLNGDNHKNNRTLVLNKGVIYNNTAVMETYDDHYQWQSSTNETVMGKDTDSYFPKEAPESRKGYLQSGCGGGVWSCPFGEMSFDVTKVLIFDNKADRPEGGNDFHKDNGFSGRVTPIGVKAPWVNDENKPLPEENKPTEAEVNLTNALGSNAYTQEEIDQATGIKIHDNISRRGGGIGTNGTLLFGHVDNEVREALSFKLTKVWDKNTNPEPIYVHIEAIASDGNVADYGIHEMNGFTSAFSPAKNLTIDYQDGKAGTIGIKIPTIVNKLNGETENVIDYAKLDEMKVGTVLSPDDWKIRITEVTKDGKPVNKYKFNVEYIQLTEKQTLPTEKIQTVDQYGKEHTTNLTYKLYTVSAVASNKGVEKPLDPIDVNLEVNKTLDGSNDVSKYKNRFGFNLYEMIDGEPHFVSLATNDNQEGNTAKFSSLVFKEEGMHTYQIKEVDSEEAFPELNKNEQTMNITVDVKKENNKLVATVYNEERTELSETNGIYTVGTFNNTTKPNAHKVKISKADIDGNEIEGAHIELYKGDQLVDSWISSNENHKVNLETGEYTFKETIAPNGYEVVTDITFNVDENGKVIVSNKQATVNKDGVLVVTDAYKIHSTKFSKVNIAGNEIEGAKIILTRQNKEGQFEAFDSWTSTTEAHNVDLIPGTYTFHEETAPKGYETVTDITFTVDMNGVINVTQTTTTKDFTVENGKVVVTDAYSTELISIPVSKQWVGRTGSKAVIDLMANGVKVESVTLNESNKWAHTFNNQFKYDQKTGELITYTVEEEAMNGYVSSKEEVDGVIVFTNTYNVQPIEVTLTAKKNLQGADITNFDGTFEFKLLDVTNKEEVKELQTTTNHGEMITFEPISFDQVGVYNYVIKEVKGSIAGMTYDSVERPITVTVTLENGKLKATVVGDQGITFNNKLVMKPATLQLSATKNLEGISFEEYGKNFKFELVELKDNQETVIETVSNNGSQISFNTLSFDHAGTHTYMVKEVNDKDPNITYGTKTDSITVTVEQVDDHFVVKQDGKKITDVINLGTITNTYTPNAMNISIHATKEVVGDASVNDFNGAFEFVLKDSNGTVVSRTKNVNGDVTFNDIKIDHEGTYVYTVEEVEGKIPGMTYSTNTPKVTVVVERQGNVLVEQNRTMEGEFNFVNNYKLEGTSIALHATKKLLTSNNDEVDLNNDETYKNAFSFKLIETIDGVDHEIETVSNVGTSIQFNNIEYKKAGKHSYKIVEVKGNDDQITYSDEILPVTVDVVKDGNLLKAKVNNEVVSDVNVGTFTNTVTLKPTFIQFKATKKLEGANIENYNQAFAFKLSEVKESGEVNQIEITRNSGENITFDAIELDHVGTYTYMIEEISTDGSKNFKCATEPKTITINVEEINHQLVVKEGDAVLDGVKNVGEFVNVYQLATVQFTASKELKNKELNKGQYSFELFETINEEDKLLQTVTNGTDEDVSKIVFNEIQYNEEGVHNYKIKEVMNPNDTDVKYDESVKDITVNVIQKDNYLLVEQGHMIDAGKFSNVYKPTTINVSATKSLVGGNLSDYNGKFNFALYDEETNTKLSEATNNGSEITFKPITYKQAGTYTYKVVEVKGNDQDVHYDDRELTFTINVIEDTDGHLVAMQNDAVVKDVNADEFVNAIKPEYKEGNIATVVSIEGEVSSMPSTIELDGDKKTVTVKDTVTYSGFKNGQEYTFVGQLMDLIDDQELQVATATKNVTVHENGTVEMIFNDVNLEVGHTYVVYETATSKSEFEYKGGNKHHEANHKDKNDINQTIVVNKKKIQEPESSIQTIVHAGGMNGTNEQAINLVIENDSITTQVTDTVTYVGLIENETYILNATLKDSNDGNVIKTVENQEFTAGLNGDVIVDFGDVTLLANHTYYVSETTISKNAIDFAQGEKKHEVNHDGNGLNSQTIAVTKKEAPKPNPNVGSIKTSLEETIRQVSGTSDSVAIVNLDDNGNYNLVDHVSYTGLFAGQDYNLETKVYEIAPGATSNNAIVKEINQTVSVTSLDGTYDVRLDGVTLKPGYNYVVTEVMESTLELDFNDGTHTHVVRHEDLNDQAQTIHVEVSNKEMPTVASIVDGESKVKAVKINETSAIYNVEDVVDCSNLVEGQEYTIEGKLVDKNTDNVISTSSTTYVVSDDKSATVLFENVTLEQNHNYVVYETATSTNEIIDNNDGTFKEHVVVHEDLNDAKQTVSVQKQLPAYVEPTLSTTATINGAKEVLVEDQNELVVVDTLHYTNLVPNVEYQATGTINCINEDGTSVEVGRKSMTFTPTTSSGDVNVEFDALSLKTNEKFVVFETLESVNDIEFEGVTKKQFIEHKDINDQQQTVTVIKKKIAVPNSSMKTVVTFDGISASDTNAAVKTIKEDSITGQLVDHVSYQGFMMDQEYTVTGRLMDIDETGNATEVASATPVTFIPTATTGSIDVNFNEVKLKADHTYVVYETSVSTNDIEFDTGTFKHEIKHENKDDLAQTVKIMKEKPSYLQGEMNTVVTFNKTSGTYQQEALVTTDEDSVEGHVVDQVSYTGFFIGQEYTLTGTLMDIDENGNETVVATATPVTFTPMNGEGVETVDFGNVNLVANHKYVVYEVAISMNDMQFSDHETSKHEVKHINQNDKAQTILIVKKQEEKHTEPKSHEVVISKVDLGGTPLVGADIKVEKIIENDNRVLVESWTTTKNDKQLELLPGTYEFIEDAAPAGYEVVTAFKFEVTSTGTVKLDEVKENEVKLTGNKLIITDRNKETPNKPLEPKASKVVISKVDLGGTPLVGAKIVLNQFVGSEKEVYESWTTTKNDKQLELFPGTYEFVEDAAPAGYEVVTAFKFEVTSDGKLILHSVKENEVQLTGNQLIVTDRKIDEPEVPNKPVTPNTPVEPNKPVTPVTPHVPEQPYVPYTPVVPHNPTPYTPITPIESPLGNDPTKPIKNNFVKISNILSPLGIPGMKKKGLPSTSDDTNINLYLILLVMSLSVSAISVKLIKE